jgi:hypothetical protein
MEKNYEERKKMNAPEMYEIRVAGYLSDNWRGRFEGLSLQQQPGGETALTGMLDQAALHGILVKIRDMGLNLISVNRIKEKISVQTEEGKWVES